MDITKKVQKLLFKEKKLCGRTTFKSLILISGMRLKQVHPRQLTSAYNTENIFS